MILTGVDNNHEDLLDWWIKNAKKYLKNETIEVWDFGHDPYDKKYYRTQSS